MSLPYKGVQNTIPNKDGEKTWRPILVRTGKTANSDEVSSLISKRTSMHKSDVQAVIRSLTEVMNEILLNGRSVHLDGFGTFTLIAKSQGTGVKNEEDVNEKQITGLRCRFTPEYTKNSFEGITRALYQGVNFINVNQIKFVNPTNKKGENSNNEEDNDDFVDPTT